MLRANDFKSSRTSPLTKAFATADENLSGNFYPIPDTTYSLLMALLPDGEFLGVIWDPSTPTNTIFYRENIGKNWANLTWRFAIGADKGTILFDNYREITFDSVK